MNPRVKSVLVKEDYLLVIEFTNQETKIFDVKPYLNLGIFKELKDTDYFKKAQVYLGTVAWNNRQDFCPDTLWLESKPIQN
ncbi:MAG: DUF2442 domain-containing protein [Chitinophagales bacterium]